MKEFEKVLRRLKKAEMKDGNVGTMRFETPEMHIYSGNGLIDLIKHLDLKKGMVMAEIGSFAGESTALFAESGIKIHAVDIWSDKDIAEKDLYERFDFAKVEETFDENTKPYANVIKHKADSKSVAASIEDLSLDFVYIDGDHRTKGVWDDIVAWYPKVKPNGFIAGHDYVVNSVQVGVLAAFNNIQPKMFRDTSWLYKKDGTYSVRKRPLIIYTHLADDGGCAYYRVLATHQKLKDKYFEQYAIEWDIGRYTIEKIKAADIILLSRATDIRIYSAIAQHKQPEAIVIWDGDDHYWAVDEKNESFKTWDNDDMRTALGVFLANSDYITASTKYLANVYKQHTDKDVVVMPNLIDPNVWERWHEERQEYLKNKKDDIIRIGWAGGASHQKDLAECTKPLLDILKKYPNVRLQIVGWPIQELFEEFKAVKNQIDFKVWEKDPRLFGKNLIEIDIGLAPLVQGMEFNKGKSSNKYLEYSMLGIPTIASNEIPYQIIKDGKTGVLVDNTYENWFAAMEFLILNSVVREKMGQNAHDYAVAEWNLNDKFEMWHRFYQSIRR